jgi:hypothetical protein
MYNLEGRKDEGLLIMGKKEPKGHCVGPRNIYKYLHLPDNVNEGNGNTNIPENLLAGFQRGHDKALRYMHHKGLVHYQRSTLVQKLPSCHLEE